jgi:hypothetical protein
MASSCIYRSSSYRSRAASLASWSLRPVSQLSAELAGQDLGAGVLQSFLFPFGVGLMMLEASLMAAQDLKLTTEGDVVLLFPLKQLSLLLLQLPL